MLACGREPEPAAEATPSASEAPRASEDAPQAPAHASDDDVRAIVESLGDEAAAVVVLRPQHWESLHGALAPWLATLPQGGLLAELPREPTAWPELLARALELPPGSLALAGWDPRRPVVASLGEVPYDGPPGAVTPQLPVLDDWIPPVRHQAWLPATDPAALTTSLTAALARAMPELPALVEGHAGARAVKGDDVTIAVLPSADAVRVVVFHGAMGRDEAARLEHMRGRLDPDARAPAASPALQHLLRSDAVLSGCLRPWRLRPLAAWWGAQQTLAALTTAAEEWRPKLLARGMQIVLDTELLMTDDGAELDDAAVSLVVDEGVLRLRGVASPTPEGQALLDAATRAAGRTHAVATDDAWIDAALRADLRAMLEATEPPPGLSASGGANALSEALSEGGGMATLYMGLRHPFGVARALEQQAKTERLPLPIDMLPTAVQVVWRGKVGDVPRVALAVEWPRSYVDRPLAGMVPLAKREPGFESLRMDTLAPDGHPITVLGLGGEGSAAFDTTKDDGFDGLLRARVSLTRIGADVATYDAERGAMLTAAGELRVTLGHREGTLAGELAWAPAGREAPRSRPVPITASERRGSPRGSVVDEASRCLADVGRRVADGLDVLSGMSGDGIEATLDTALAKSEVSLPCAVARPHTAAAALGLRRMLVRLAADAMVADGQLAAARALLEAQCERTKDVAICEEASAEPAKRAP